MRQPGSDALTDALKKEAENIKSVKENYLVTFKSILVLLTWLLPLGLALILGVIIGQAVQDENLSPLCALVESRQQLVDVLGIEVQQVAVGVRLADL